MLRIIDQLPDEILGIEASGQVTADDYRLVLVPAVEERLRQFDRLRLLYILGPEFENFSGGAAWQDAMLGMKHFTAFERIAFVTDKEWLQSIVHAFGFVMPGEVENFDYDELAEARAWIEAPASPGSLEFELLEDENVLVLRPHDELERGDFERVADAVDPWLEEHGRLAGIVVVAPEFPGWDNFSALIAHLGFVRHHHRKVGRVALVTSSRFVSMLPRLAGIFVAAEVRHFEVDAEGAAFNWARQG